MSALEGKDAELFYTGGKINWDDGTVTEPSNVMDGSKMNIEDLKEIMTTSYEQFKEEVLQEVADSLKIPRPILEEVSKFKTADTWSGRAMLRQQAREKAQASPYLQDMINRFALTVLMPKEERLLAPINTDDGWEVFWTACILYRSKFGKLPCGKSQRSRIKKKRKKKIMKWFNEGEII